MWIMILIQICPKSFNLTVTLELIFNKTLLST